VKRIAKVDDLRSFINGERGGDRRPAVGAVGNLGPLIQIKPEKAVT
jgi:hypothetical protein